jgi:hypothetical protein
MNKLLLFFFLFSGLSHADDICTRSQDNIRTILKETSSRIAFENAGGLINGGVCWWHSRLQRSSTYLVKWRPEERTPTRPELHKILHTLRTMTDTVVIPGYSDFNSFTRDHQEEVQALLEDWQRRDGFLNFEWIRGISGKFSLPPAKMKARMDEVYRYYKNSPAPLWIMAQVKGITSHSFLILSMQNTEDGYLMSVIDSNHPLKTLMIEYQVGDSYLRNDSYTFVPYVGFQNDFRLISRSLIKRCGSNLIEFQDVEEGEIESGNWQY